MAYKTDKIFLNDWWDISVFYHPTKTGKIIINIPGASGSANGYMDKYLNIANSIQSKNIASFVRIPNDRPQEFINTARQVINYCLDNSEKICGVSKPEIWLMGFSAGGASVLLTAWEYPEVTKALVINPFINLPETRKDLKEYLPSYEGELFVVVASDDRVIAPDTLKFISECIGTPKEFQTEVILDCDHQLRGEENGEVLFQLPEYYFLGKYKKEAFPVKNDHFFI